ncbi:MAG: hypothetical protein K2W96_04815 [Gemmataceae bacterium]|nr:hypothetical protein [Gemmataceae bacterium]
MEQSLIAAYLLLNCTPFGKWLDKLDEFFAWSSASPDRRPTATLVLETMEDRTCPAGDWLWSGPVGGGANNWSNPTGQAWQVRFLPGGAFVQAGANQYPGMPGSTGDNAFFTDRNSGNSTLDVVTGGVRSVTIFGWGGQLNIEKNLGITGAGGFFQLADANAAVLIEAGSHIALINATGNSGWSAGQINATVDPMAGTRGEFYVSGSTLGISGTPGGPGADLIIQGTGAMGNPGVVALASMTGNLPLAGTDNRIKVWDGGQLNLAQQIANNGRKNLDGGIDSVGRSHKVAVEIEAGGIMQTFMTALPGVANQVAIQGVVKNKGGTVSINDQAMINITGKDAADRSYWQQAGALAKLQIAAGGNLAGLGTVRIDIGLAEFTAPSGGSAEVVRSAGLVFGNANQTLLTIKDSGAGTGTLTVHGSVTLAANTITTMNFKGGAAPAADLIGVRGGGTLTLAGTLRLKGSGGLPAVPLVFFDVIDAMPTLNGGFATITDDQGGTNDVGAVVNNPPQQKKYQVTIQ